MSHLRGVLGALIATSAAAFLFVTSISIAAQAPTQTSRTVQDGVFSDAQATRGQALYGQRCAGCHGPALAGAQGPPLAGEAFVNTFRMEPLSALFIKIRYKMPPTPPGATPGTPLTSEQAADLVAHVLKSNGFPAGKTDFASSDAVNSEIGWPAAATPPSSRAPTGTLNQLMRGIFFHNSNLIFSVQEMEPADLPPKPPPSRPDGLTTFDWGLMIYTGWPAVENAASSIADASTLLLQPGLRCENGRAAPVTEPDWIRLTERMIAVAKRTTRLAQTQSKEAVSEYTLDLSNACNACHLTYRDVGGRGRGRGGNPPGATGNLNANANAMRCMHR
jgi:mono/diheme cytochrome c family protein